MKKTIPAVMAATVVSISASAGSAAVLNFSEGITVVGQNFSFSSAAPANAAGGGILEIVLNGDFTNGAPNVESAQTVSFTGVAGSLALGNEVFGDNVVSNTISGLGFLGVSENCRALDDCDLDYTFSVNDGLLDDILVGGTFDMFIDLSSGVHPFNRSDNDFVSATLTYNDAAVIPLPAGFPLLGAGLVALGLLRRRKQS